jgi:hypothetical protein
MAVILMWYLLDGRRSFPNKSINSREKEDDMIPQREVSESIYEQADSTYGKYEGDQEDARQHGDTSYEQPLREVPGGKVYPPQSGNMNLFYQFVIVFVLSMVALFAFAVLCLVYVGGTGGWIGFIAVCFAILCIASTFIAVKREGGK